MSLWGPVPLASVPVVAGRQSISGEKLQELGKLVKFFRMEHKCVFFPLALRKGINSFMYKSDLFELPNYIEVIDGFVTNGSKCCPTF